MNLILKQIRILAEISFVAFIMASIFYALLCSSKLIDDKLKENPPYSILSDKLNYVVKNAYGAMGCALVPEFCQMLREMDEAMVCSKKPDLGLNNPRGKCDK